MNPYVMVTEIRSLDEWKKLCAEAAENRRIADGHVTPEIEASAIYGAHFIRLYAIPGGCLTIYGEIIEPMYEEDRAQYNDPSMRYMRLTRCYSQAEAAGEYGNVHIATMTAFISKEQFKKFQADGWPSLHQPS